MKEFIMSFDIDTPKIGASLMGGGALSKELGTSPFLYTAGFICFVVGCFLVGFKRKTKV